MNKMLMVHTGDAMGGAEYSFCELLPKLGNSIPGGVHVVFFRTGKFFGDTNPISVHYPYIRLAYLKKNRNLRSLTGDMLTVLSGSVKMYRLVRRENIGVVFCNTFRSLPYCLLIKLFTRARIVCCCRDNLSSSPVKMLIKSFADELIAVSGNIYGQLPRKSKVHLVHNGINPFLYSRNRPKTELHRRYHLSEKTRLIGNIGRIMPWKNQWDFITVAERLLRDDKDLHFFLIGAVSDEGYFDGLRERIGLLGLESYVTFAGHTDTVADYLSGLSVVLHTAIDEPFGRVLIEAGASTRPVVAYDSGGPSEIIDDGVTGFLVPQGKTEEMAELTAALLRDSDLRQLMGRSARRRVIRRFNHRDYVRNVYRILMHD